MWQADQATIIKILLVGPCNAASQTRIQLSASSSELCPCPVACILSAFICQINSQKGKPNLRFETISAGKVRTTNQPPSSSSSFTLPPKSYIQKDSPFALFCSTASAAAAVVCPAGTGRHLSSAQLSSASTQFVTIPFCGLIFALLVSLSYLALPYFPPSSLPSSLSNPIPDRLRFYLPRCPARPNLPFVCSVCFRTLFKLTCAYFLMLSCVCLCVWKVLLLSEKVSVHCDLRPQIIIFNTVLIV